VDRSAKRGESKLTDECHQTPDKEDPSPKSTQAEEEQEFFDIVGKEHVERRAKTADDVRSIIERIKAGTRAS
jgi:hypothetical protein